MSSSPPNNLDQVVAWIRVFIQENSNAIQFLRNDVDSLKDQMKGEDNVDI